MISNKIDFNNHHFKSGPFYSLSNFGASPRPLQIAFFIFKECVLLSPFSFASFSNASRELTNNTNDKHITKYIIHSLHHVRVFECSFCNTTRLLTNQHFHHFIFLSSLHRLNFHSLSLMGSKNAELLPLSHYCEEGGRWLPLMIIREANTATNPHHLLRSLHN